MTYDIALTPFIISTFVYFLLFILIISILAGTMNGSIDKRFNNLPIKKTPIKLKNIKPKTIPPGQPQAAKKSAYNQPNAIPKTQTTAL